MASLRFSSSSRYESAGSTSIRSTPPSRRSSITGSLAVPRIVEEERPVAADRLELVAFGKSRPAVELGEDVTREAHRAREDPVGSARADELLPVHALGLTAEQTRSTDAVAADIHQAAALELGAQSDVLRVVERKAEAGPDDTHVSDRALVHELPKSLGLWVVAIHERLHQDPLRLLCRVECGFDVPDVPAQRLLAEHVLSRLDSADRPLAVQRVRQRDVHGLDVVVLEQRLVGAVRAVDLPLARVFLGPAQVAARHGYQLDFLRGVSAGNDLPVDVGGREDPPLDCCVELRHASSRGRRAG